MYQQLRRALLLALLASTPPDVLGSGMDRLTLRVTATIVTGSCRIPTEDQTIELDFGRVSDISLYHDTKSQLRPFTIHLQDCDPVSAENLRVRFEGIESRDVPGKLALTSGTASGVVIGLAEGDGVTDIDINTPSASVVMTQGDMSLNFVAYLMGTPTALIDHSIVTGDFMASATFTLEYQ